MSSGSLCTSISMRSGKCRLDSPISMPIGYQEQCWSRAKKKPLALVSKRSPRVGADAHAAKQQGLDHWHGAAPSLSRRRYHCISGLTDAPCSRIEAATVSSVKLISCSASSAETPVFKANIR